jgi:hypothetical protein
MKTRLGLAVSHIVQQEQGRIEKNLLGFGGADPVFVILSLVACIPLKTVNGGQIDHDLYITIIYTDATPTQLPNHHHEPPTHQLRISF